MTIAKITMSIIDAKARIGRLIFYTDVDSYGFVTGDRLQEIDDYFSEVARRLDAIISGAIISLDISVSVNLSAGMKASPLATSDVEEKALFVYPKTASGGAYFAHRVPTFNHALFPPGTDQMAYSGHADVAYYAALVFNPTEALDWASEVGDASDNRGQSIKGAPLLYKRFSRSKP
jgi:hypothetical protein